MGWHDDGAAFVLPGATYPRDARLRFEPEQKRAYAVARKSGTFGGWKAEVAGPAACSSRMVFGIGAALKPPLLLYAGKRAGGVAVTVEGPSRSGKSITLMAAKSVIDEPVLDSWGLSRAGGAAALLGHTDLPLFLDETRAVRGGEAKGGSIVGEVTRLLSGGRPDILDPAWVAEHRQAAGRAAIRSVLLTSTEGRLDPARLPGERARMVALPACRPGSFGVIDHPERADPPIRDAAAAAEAMERLERGAGRHHGQALPRFVRRLVKMKRGRVQKLIREYRDAFYKTADGAALGGWSRSILEWFALVYAALMLARRLKIVPWPEAVIRDAVLRCWRDAMEQEARAADAPLQVVERLRCWLRDAPERAVVDADFDPRRLNNYDVVLDRDAGVPVALAQRKRLAGIAGGEAPLDAALLLLRQRGDVVPNPKTGQVTRQKRFKGTGTKLRFVFFTQAFLDGAENG